jgi:hypothetical protein
MIRKYDNQTAADPTMNGLAYKPQARDVVNRLRSLYERRSRDQIFATMAVPSQAIAEFKHQHPEIASAYPDPSQRAAFWDKLFQERIPLQDDSMPAAYLSEFDQGLYGGLLGGEVQFMAHPENGWISSMVPPLLQDWVEFEALHFDASHPWWQRYLNQLNLFVERASGKWGLSHFILIDGLNFVFELVGATRTYLSLIEHPEYVRRALDLAFAVNVKVQRTFFEKTLAFEGGTLSNFAQWLPGRIVSESLDPFHMTSVDYFEQWGRQPAERILAAFDGGVLHIHGNGRHLLQAASTLRGLKAILLLDDLHYPLAFDQLQQLLARTGDVPVSVFAPYEQFLDRLNRHTLPGGVLYQVTDVPDIASANRCMEKVRAYRA